MTRKGETAAILAALGIAGAGLYYGTIYTADASSVRGAAEAFRSRVAQGSQFRCESQSADVVICKTPEATVRMVLKNNYWQSAD